MHVWYVDAGIEDTPEPVYTHCLVLSYSLVISYVAIPADVDTDNDSELIRFLLFSFSVFHFCVFGPVL